MNYYYPHDQLRLVVSMIAVGFIIGIVYDCFRIKQKLLFSPSFILIIDDLLFSIISVVLFILSTFLFNNGIVRWYSAVFAFLGFVVYRATISVLVMAVMLLVVTAVHYSLKFVIKLTLFPMQKMWMLSYKPRIYIHRMKIKNRLEREMIKMSRV